MLNRRLIIAVLKRLAGRKVPMYVHYFTTYRCNLDCKMCNVHRLTADSEMSLEQIEEMAGILSRLGVAIVNISGGEPFLRDDLAEIVRIFARKKFSVRVQTNGLEATEDRIRAIVEAGVKGVSVSLDTLEEHIQDGIAGKQGTFRKILESIGRFCEIFPLKGAYLILDVVVSRLNIHQLPELARFAESIGWFVNLTPVHLAELGDNNPYRAHAEAMKFRPRDNPVIDNIYDELIMMKRKKGAVANSNDFLKESKWFLKTGKSKWICNAGRNYFLIRPDGGFSPCCDFITSSNIFDEELLKELRRGKLPDDIIRLVELCPGCMYPCWAEIERLTWPKVLYERIFTTRLDFFSKRPSLIKEQAIDLAYQMAPKGIV